MKVQETLQVRCLKEEDALHVLQTMVEEGFQDTNARNATLHFVWSMRFWFVGPAMKTSQRSETFCQMHNILKIILRHFFFR